MNKFWTANYPKGVLSEVEIPAITLVDMFDDTCSKFASSKAVTCHNTSLTFKEFRQQVERLSYSLQQMGVGAGDRVAIIMPNIMQYPIAIFAILKLGAVVVNINPLYTSSEIEYIIEDSGAKVALVLNLIAGRLNELVKSRKLRQVVVTRIPDSYSSWLKRGLINLVIEKIKRLDVSYDYKAVKFADCISHNNPVAVAAKIKNTDLAFIQYTGATTGRPKGAMLSHHNIVANVTQVFNWLIPQVGQLSGQVVIDALPLYHIFSLTANLFTFFFAGSENVMVPNPKDVSDTVKILKSSNFTVFSALDTLYNHLLSNAEFTSNKYPYFRYSVAGGMPARPSVANKWFAVTGVMPSNCYGMTEASPAVTMNTFDDVFDGSVGFPIPNTEVEIRDEQTKQVLAQGEHGVIWVRGPQLMSGYWNNPQQTATAIDEAGWFNTGDIGYFNPQGKLFISGRLSDMIIVSGFNVYPVEIEVALDALSDIKESAVIGVKDDATGEKIVAFVVFKEGRFMVESEIIHNLRKKLTNYKIPRQIVILSDALPKTLVGKIDKVTLSNNYSAGKL